MNCPHCQKALPENYTASYCPHCGAAVKPAEPVLVRPSPLPLPPRRLRLPIFFGIMLAPPLLTMLIAFLGKGHENEQVSPVIGFFGGAAAGIACGVMLALRTSHSIAGRVILGILLSIVFVVVCIMLSFFGCMAVGYHLNL
jgi:hypothetical protein